MNDYKGLICGDSDIIVDKMIDAGLQFDLILTDPPYNINKDFGNDSDKLSVEEFVKVTKQRVEKYKQLLKPNGSIIWFGIHDYIGYIQIAMYDAGLFYRRINIWHYENGFSRSSKEPATHYEPFIWFSKNQKKWTYNCDEVRVKNGVLDKKYNVKLPDGKYNLRAMSVLEVERLQTLTDGYTKVDGVSDAQRLNGIGNGWTIDIICELLRGLL